MTPTRSRRRRAALVGNSLAGFLLLVVLADGVHDGGAHLADELRTVLCGPIPRARGRNGRALEMREDVARHELVAPAGGGRVRTLVRHVEEGPEATTGLVDEPLELRDRIVGCTDDGESRLVDGVGHLLGVVSVRRDR